MIQGLETCVKNGRALKRVEDDGPKLAIQGQMEDLP